MFKRVSGTKDILPDQINLWQEIEKISRNIFSLFNYQEIRPPLIEEASLFNRSLGETTEIVQKQMFLVKNNQETYALRPEGTVSIVRAYLENNLDKTSPFVKLYYIGPMFRLERPQKGRFRQFHHIGCEVIGSDDPLVDAENISLADKLLKCFKIEGYKILINSLGCLEDKKSLTQILHHSLKDKLDKLCDECRVRYSRNVLRILDCKNESCLKITGSLGLAEKHLCPDCQKHYDAVLKGLDTLKINYEKEPHLVRGLDYYTRTVFEIKHKDLDSQQDALGAGGRYDNLVGELGGPKTGAIGFALGLERLLLFTGLKPAKANNKLIYVITLGEEARKVGLNILSLLRREGLAADTDFESKSLKGALRKANDFQAKFVVLVGDDELREQSVTLKDMSLSSQKKVKIEDLVREVSVC